MFFLRCFYHRHRHQHKNCNFISLLLICYFIYFSCTLSVPLLYPSCTSSVPLLYSYCTPPETRTTDKLNSIIPSLSQTQTLYTKRKFELDNQIITVLRSRPLGSLCYLNCSKMRTRVFRDCPVPHCGARYLVKLPNHLTAVHGLENVYKRPNCNLRSKLWCVKTIKENHWVRLIQLGSQRKG